MREMTLVNLLSYLEVRDICILMEFKSSMSCLDTFKSFLGCFSFINKEVYFIFYIFSSTLHRNITLSFIFDFLFLLVPLKAHSTCTFFYSFVHTLSPSVHNKPVWYFTTSMLLLYVYITDMKCNS